MDVDNIPNEYFLRFPPFPAAPEGVTIIPFKDFKPAGIRVPMDDMEDDDVERDGLGVPTVPLRVKHNTDDQEKKKRKKKKNGAPPVSVAPGKPKTWWEIWEELEDVRKNHYDPNASRVDRLFQAAHDFKEGRSWPGPSSGLFNLWDQFRLYIGLLHHPVIQRKAAPEAGSDDSEDEEPPARETTVFVPPPPPAPGADGSTQPPQQKKRRRLFRAIGSAYDDAEQQEEEEGLTFEDKLVAHTEEKDIRMENFLNDPETSIKIFFSSYFRDRGLIWSEPRCTSMPILISFFLRYLLRSRVLPEREHEKPLRRALEVVELAQKELPITFVMGRTLADKFSEGCQQCWSSPQPGWELPTTNSADAGASEAKDEPSRDSMDEPDLKRVKLDKAVQDGSSAPKSETTSDPIAEALKSGGAVLINSSVDAPAPTIVPIINGQPSEADGVGWANAKDNAWGDPDQTIPWGDGDAPDAPSVWDTQLPSLFPLLGPTALPLTHTSGVVERSTRRIVSLHPPLAPRVLPLAVGGASAVEEELERRFARVVLAPWPPPEDAERSDVIPPEILPTSRGAVVEKGKEAVPDEAVKMHDPYKDEISLLVLPEHLDIFIVGMGLGATWTEMVRVPDAEGKKGKKGKNSKKRDVPKYWYMEQLMHQLPSYHTEMLAKVKY